MGHIENFLDCRLPYQTLTFNSSLGTQLWLDYEPFL